MMGGGGGGDGDNEEMPDLDELQEKWRKTRNQDYRASMAKERLKRKLENKQKRMLNQQRFQEKSKQRTQQPHEVVEVKEKGTSPL